MSKFGEAIDALRATCAAMLLLVMVIASPFVFHLAILDLKDRIAQDTARTAFIERCVEKTDMGEEGCTAEWYIRVEKGIRL